MDIIKMVGYKKEEERLSVRICLYANEMEYVAIKSMAERDGQRRATWVRDRIVEYLRECDEE